MIRTSIMILLAVVMMVACKSNNDGLMPSVTGKAFEIIVVMEDEHWKSEAGEAIRQVLGSDLDGLTQSEPTFTLVQIPNEAFTAIFRTHRNILRVGISPDNRKKTLLFSSNVYAQPQLIADIKSETTQDLKAIVESQSELIFSKFNDMELNRIAKNYLNYEEVEIGTKLRENHQISMIFPKGYRYDVNQPDFAWISHETAKHSQGVLVYHYDYVSEEAFSLDSLINRRNEMLKKYVPGPIENTYMTTALAIPVEYRQFMKDSVYYAELRGLWELAGPDFMGGPFVSLSRVDTFRGRIVTVEGFVYAPRDDKRNFVRQLEAILHSLTIVEPEAQPQLK